MKLLIRILGIANKILIISFLVEMLLTMSKLVPVNKHEIILFYAILYTLPIMAIVFFIFQEVKYNQNSKDRYTVYGTIAMTLVIVFSCIRFLTDFYAELPLVLLIYGLLKILLLPLAIVTMVKDYLIPLADRPMGRGKNSRE